MRGGFAPAEAGRAARRIHDTPGVELASLWTHLASSHDPAATTRQRERLALAAKALTDEGVDLPPRHWAATGGLLSAVAAGSDLVRPGLLLYGVLPDAFPVAPAARPIAVAVRPGDEPPGAPAARHEAGGRGAGRAMAGRGSRRGPRSWPPCPIGYGDGWSRAYGGRSQALVRGRRVPLVGSVAMDAVLADVTDVPGVTTADEFVLLGEQAGERITAADLAHVRTTISWEVLASMSARVARVYHAAAGLTGLRTLAGEYRRAEEQRG